MVKRKAAFFDRDGTLIKDVHYLSRFEDVEVLPGSIELCQRLRDQGYELFIVTNQSGIGRGFFSTDFVHQTHELLCELFADEGVSFSQFYFCPHLPLQNCLCRKPSPGMLHQAAREHGLDLSQSLMIGDKESDIQAGLAAGCKSFYIKDVKNYF